MSRNKRKAFTLTELLVVVVVIGVLAAVVLPKYTKVIETRKTTEAENMMAAVRTEQEHRCALDKPYAADLTKLAGVLPSAVTKNFSYTLQNTGVGMEAQSLGKYNYKLEMPSYADGRICCSGRDCNKLNKDYPNCNNLTHLADYRESSACAADVPAPAVYDCVEVSGPKPEDEPRACNSCGTQTRSAHCNESTGHWYWKEDWGACSVTDVNECREKCEETCGEGMIRNPSVMYKDEEKSCCWYDCEDVCGTEINPYDFTFCKKYNDQLTQEAENERNFYWGIFSTRAEYKEGCVSCIPNNDPQKFMTIWHAEDSDNLMYLVERDGSKSVHGKVWDSESCSRFKNCPPGYALDGARVCRKESKFVPVAYEFTAIYLPGGYEGAKANSLVLMNGGEEEWLEASLNGKTGTFNNYCWVNYNSDPRKLLIDTAIVQLPQCYTSICESCDETLDTCDRYCIGSESSALMDDYRHNRLTIKTVVTKDGLSGPCQGIPLKIAIGGHGKLLVPEKTHEDGKIKVYFCEPRE